MAFRFTGGQGLSEQGKGAIVIKVTYKLRILVVAITAASMVLVFASTAHAGESPLPFTDFCVGGLGNCSKAPSGEGTQEAA